MDGLYIAARLREEARLPSSTALDIERILPRLYPVIVVRVDSLTVRRIESWLESRGLRPPGSLRWCQDRPLRGGVVAACGRALLFIDSADGAAEQSYTAAHEAGHYLGDHLYPRKDAAERLGAQILEVLDGRRSPTPEERAQAFLRRAELTRMTHLLARDASAMADAAPSEREADRFACEAIAPLALVELRICAGAEPNTLLQSEFGLPAQVAERYARQFLPETSELLDRLQIGRGMTCRSSAPPNEEQVVEHNDEH
jgi:hypothetical protein